MILKSGVKSSKLWQSPIKVLIVLLIISGAITFFYYKPNPHLSTVLMYGPRNEKEYRDLVVKETLKANKKLEDTVVSKISDKDKGQLDLSLDKKLDKKSESSLNPRQTLLNTPKASVEPQWDDKGSTPPVSPRPFERKSKSRFYAYYFSKGKEQFKLDLFYDLYPQKVNSFIRKFIFCRKQKHENSNLTFNNEKPISKIESDVDGYEGYIAVKTNQSGESDTLFPVFVSPLNIGHDASVIGGIVSINPQSDMVKMAPAGRTPMGCKDVLFTQKLSEEDGPEGIAKTQHLFRQLLETQTPPMRQK